MIAFSPPSSLLPQGRVLLPLSYLLQRPLLKISQLKVPLVHLDEIAYFPSFEL